MSELEVLKEYEAIGTIACEKGEEVKATEHSDVGRYPREKRVDEGRRCAGFTAGLF